MEERAIPAVSDFWKVFGRPAIAGVPKYVQLRESLHAAILAGHWPPGSRVPTEDELARLTRFSLGTVQRSLRELADEGVLVRAQGSGTFVADRIAPIDEPLHLRFLGRGSEARTLPLFSKVLSRSTVTEPGRWNELLGPGDQVIRIERRLNVGGEFDVFSRMYFRAETSPTTATRPLKALDGENLKQLIGGQPTQRLRTIEQKVSFVRFTAAIARAVNVRTGVQGMLLESAANAGRGPALYFLESYIPPNDRQLDLGGG